MIAAEESSMPRTPVLILAFAGLLAVSSEAQQPSPLAGLKTTAESSGFKSTSTYDDVVKFMKAVDDASPLVFYTTYGKTYEGRDMPMAVVGTGLRDASAAAVRATNKLRVHVQGNIHAGEVEGKEAAQILLRELALGQRRDWLQSMVFLITPIFNADGNERFELNNRGRQNGPINGMGTRANGQGLNINRDFTRLDTPESAAFVKLWIEFDPHVGFDLHTSDGSTHGYHLTYSPPLHPNTNATIMKMMKDEWFPFVTKNIQAKHGWHTFYYGNVGRAGGPGPGAGQPEVVGAQPAPGASARSWGTFEHLPRYHNNYVGLRNRFAVLSEAYAYATFEDRIKATNYLMEESLNFAHQNQSRIKQTVVEADKETLVGKNLGTRAQIKSGGLIEILMGEVEDETNPNNGATMNRRKDVIKPEQMVDRLWFEPTATEAVPAEFYVPAEATKALELLRSHGVTVRRLTQPVRGVEQFAIATNTVAQGRGGRGRAPGATPPGVADPGRAGTAGDPGRAARAGDPARAGGAGGGQGRGTGVSADTGTHQLRRLDGAWQLAPEVSVPAGAFAVPMNQPLARLAFYLLAPTSDDGLTAWNYLDDMLGADAKVYPILRRR
jgi:hypothetical protein